MIIGIDFDNTLVSYDRLFHRVARELDLIPADLLATKTAVRDHLRATGREAAWTEMQGTVYGARIVEAQPYPGAHEFVESCRERGIPVRIISHKTRHPYLGESHDLHAAARSWLHKFGFINPSAAGLNDSDVFFEVTKSDKLKRIAACGCTHFVDDLPELLGDAAFPHDVVRYLFDPQNAHASTGELKKVSDWTSLKAILLDTKLSASALDRVAAAAGIKLAGSALEPVTGGANNRVYRVAKADGEPVLVKHYFQHPGDTRDRFASERAFYRYANAIDLRNIPIDLGWNKADRVGLFSFVDGDTPVIASLASLNAAIAFVTDLNRQHHLPEARELPSASEACFSIAEHLDFVQRRITRMESLPSNDALDADAIRFVQQELVPVWETTRDGLHRQYNASKRSKSLTTAERCISPSDFGFHNSLVRENGETVFIDFEYAGWDDPAKLIGDFFCQPDLPVSIYHLDQFATSIAAALRLSNPSIFTDRCHALLPVYRIKWSCILLNDFTALGRERRVFSLGATAAAARRERQLNRARAMLGNLLQAA